MPKDADFKAREFREAVRNILQGYRKEYLAIGDALVESVLQKFNDGVPMTRAVEDAIRDVGFFGANAQAVSQMLFLAACAGYGILPKFVAAPSEADIKRKLTETAWTGDGMKLSKRLHALPVRNNIVSALGIALRQVKSIKDIAMELYDGYNSGKGILSKATLRKDMAKLLRTAEAALGDGALMSDLRRQAVTLQSLPHGIKSPRLQAVYNELVKACTADELKAAAIKRAAWAAVEEKTRYHAERIARTEAARAWFDGYIAERESDEDVWGYRWRLSSRHHLCPFDQCDVCANMDVGYGKGIYPKHKVPSIPRHPHCMCMLEDVFSWERKGKKIKPEGARRYIDSLDEKRKSALFGDAGVEVYEKGGDWQKLLRGWDGFQKPKSRLSAGDFKFDLQLFAGGKIPDTLLDGSPYNLTIRRQVQNRHIPGTKEYDRYVEQLKDLNLQPSVFHEGVTQKELERLVKKYHGTGMYDPNPLNGSPREKVDTGVFLGQYWDTKKGKLVDTTWLELVYSKHGTHVYSVKPPRGV